MFVLASGRHIPDQAEAMNSVLERGRCAIHHMPSLQSLLDANRLMRWRRLSVFARLFQR